MKFKAEFLRNELDLPDDAVNDRIIDNGRWNITHEIVFEYESKYYKTSYTVGSTEMQDELPWQYEDEVECKEVELKEVIVKKWVEV